jgi:hypothetical protein
MVKTGALDLSDGEVIDEKDKLSGREAIEKF